MTSFVPPDFSTALIADYHRYRSFDLVVDSRRVGRPEATLFFALGGQRRDGHEFIPALLARGVRHFVVTIVPKEVPEGGDVRFVVVPSVLHYLQLLAAYHRRQFTDVRVIAITGSNGKTMVKDYLSTLLQTSYRVCASPRSFNSQIGVALSVWQLRPGHEYAVFEAGIDRPREMAVLEWIIQPHVGVFTTLGTAHLQAFTDSEQLAQEKLTLFCGVETLLVPDNESEILGYILRRGWMARTLSVDLSTQITVHGGGRSFRGGGAEAAIYRRNRHLAVAVARLVGVVEEAIESTYAKLAPLSNRLEQRAGRDGGPLINDSYSNDFSALAAAIDFAVGQDPYGSLTLILGRVQPLPDLHRRLEGLLDGTVKRILAVGFPELGGLALGLTVEGYPTVEAMVEALPELDFTGQTVLVKGPSIERFDRIADALSKRLHRTTLRTSLTAIRKNIQVYRGLLPADCRLLVMTKASAYGSGALPVARCLQDSGADYLGVAYPEEGRELREGGIRLPILVLNAEPYAFPLMREFKLEPAIHNLGQFHRAVEYGLPMHLEVDTGMARLGFSITEMAALGKKLGHPLVRSLFSHLVASEATRHDQFTRTQIETFGRVLQGYRSVAASPVWGHLLNSNGISRYPEAAYGMVRLGIGLYGIGDARLGDRLSAVLCLTATVSAINEYPAGTSVGYGRQEVLSRDSTVAVVSIGYADGLPRSAGNGRYALRIAGKEVPTIGAICMDMCMVDVTGVGGVRIGGEVTVFGPYHSVERLAEVADTIPYEILTGIGVRVHRVYVGE